MNDFNSDIKNLINKKSPTVFDIGCFNGNFSKKLKEKLNSSTKNFYLFDANPNLKLKEFKYFNMTFSDKIKILNFNLNTFLPSSGSSLKKIIKKDKMWNFSRKLFTFNINKSFVSLKVKTNTLDNFCKLNKIKKIDLLKIDVEGSELDVLKGGKNILKNVKIIQLEILQSKNNFLKEKNKIVGLLNKYNLRIFSEKKIKSVTFLSNIVSEDILFVKK